MHMIRCVDGKAVELWHVMDTLTMLGQLGLLPGRSAAANPAVAGSAGN
jgi:hypothetical protein